MDRGYLVVVNVECGQLGQTHEQILAQAGHLVVVQSQVVQAVKT